MKVVITMVTLAFVVTLAHAETQSDKLANDLYGCVPPKTEGIQVTTGGGTEQKVVTIVYSANFWADDKSHQGIGPYGAHKVFTCIVDKLDNQGYLVAPAGILANPVASGRVTQTGSIIAVFERRASAPRPKVGTAHH